MCVCLSSSLVEKLQCIWGSQCAPAAKDQVGRLGCLLASLESQDTARGKVRGLHKAVRGEDGRESAALHGCEEK